MANGLFQRMREIAGSLDLLEQDLLQRRDRRGDCLDPLVAPSDHAAQQEQGHPAGHRRRPDPLDQPIEV